MFVFEMVRVYIYEHVYVCVFAHKCMYTHTVCVRGWGVGGNAFMCVSVGEWGEVGRMCVHMCVCMCVCVCVCVCTYVYVCAKVN